MLPRLVQWQADGRGQQRHPQPEDWASEVSRHMGGVVLPRSEIATPPEQWLDERTFTQFCSSIIVKTSSKRTSLDGIAFLYPETYDSDAGSIELSAGANLWFGRDSMPDDVVQREIDDPVISIGILAQKVGLSVSAVRKYENEGLIVAHRTASGHRLFSREDISRVKNIHHLIQDVGLNVEGIRRMQALLPCWELLPCTAETPQSCPAYKDNSRPCWMIKGLNCAPQGNECRQCVVYRFGSQCTEEIKSLVHDQTGSLDSSAAIEELLERKRRSRRED